MRTKRNTADRRRRFLAVLVMALMLITEWHMALVVIGAVMIGLLPMYVVGRHARRNVPAQTEARDRLHSYTEEIYQGHDAVRLSRQIDRRGDNVQIPAGTLVQESADVAGGNGWKFGLCSSVDCWCRNGDDGPD